MRLHLKILIFLMALIPVAIGGAWAGSAAPSKDDSGAAQQRPKVVFPKIEFTFDALFEGQDIKHDFVIENRGDAPLIIKNVKPG